MAMIWLADEAFIENMPPPAGRSSGHVAAWRAVYRTRHTALSLHDAASVEAVASMSIAAAAPRDVSITVAAA